MTIVLNAHGTLVEMSDSLEHGQNVSLQNVKTSEKIECTVKLVTPTGTGKFNVAMEFRKPNPGFWQISFPRKTGPPQSGRKEERLRISRT